MGGGKELNDHVVLHGTALGYTAKPWSQLFSGTDMFSTSRWSEKFWSNEWSVKDNAWKGTEARKEGKKEIEALLFISNLGRHAPHFKSMLLFLAA